VKHIVVDEMVPANVNCGIEESGIGRDCGLRPDFVPHTVN
jgi:hypothetical protein